MTKTDGKENILGNALNEIFCRKLHLVLAQAIFYQYVRIDWSNKIQNFKIRNICTFVHKYEAISSSLINEHHVISKYFLYIYILYEYEGILKCPKFLELQYCKVELFQRRKERKIDHKIIQQSTPNTLLNIELIHKDTQKT